MSNTLSDSTAQEPTMNHIPSTGGVPEGRGGYEKTLISPATPQEPLAKTPGGPRNSLVPP